MKIHDLTNKKFGRLSVVGRTTNKGKCVAWECLCDCGKTKIAITTNLTRGLTKSCGCLHSEVTSKAASTHGMSKSRIFTIWQNMLARCSNQNRNDYLNYGGRGISVCDWWAASFENFLKDMGNPPSRDHSLDRINVDGNYCAENCRWATSQEQALNKRTNRIIEFNGITAPLKEHCNILGISYKSVHARITRGWSVSDALTTPINTTTAA